MQPNLNTLLVIYRRRQREIWIPTVVCGLLGLLYALLAPRFWSAKQALYVRDEGGGISQHQGRFSSVDAMQTAQETILEVARHQSVLQAVLQECGPEKKLSDAQMKTWPSGKAIDAFRNQVKVTAPPGTQFGRTELIYLVTKARTPERAVRLSDSLTRHLIRRMQKLREEKYGGLVKELEQTVRVAQGELDQSTLELQKLEQSVGADLAELRVLMNEGQGDGHLRRTASEITRELRLAETKLVAKRQELEQLMNASHDPQALIALPSQILDAQPLLKRLKEGLVEAQIRVSRALGELNPEHPRAQAAILAEQKLRDQVVAELQTALRAVRNEVDVLEQQIQVYRNRGGENSSRLENLAELRTRYANAVAEVKQRTQILETAQRDLTNARANLLAASASSLIQRVERPVPSSQPLGPGRTFVVLMSTLAGLASGIGMVFLLEPMGTGSMRRRWTDVAQYGRRATDFIRQSVTSTWPYAERRSTAGGDRRKSQRRSTNPASGANMETEFLRRN